MFTQLSEIYFIAVLFYLLSLIIIEISLLFDVYILYKGMQLFNGLIAKAKL